MGAAFLAGGIPWYTLKLFPLVTFGAAKINLLDALVGGAVGAGSLSLLQKRRAIDPLAVAGLLFTGSMVVALLMGMAQAGNAFFAIREMRALAYYLLVPVLVLLRFDSREYRLVFGSWLGGAFVGVGLAFLHIVYRLPLPGYPASPPMSAEQAAIRSLSWNEYIPLAPTLPALMNGFRVQYLEWTAAVVAVLIAGATTLAARRIHMRGFSLGMLLALFWYQLAAGARAMQLASMFALVAVAALLLRRRRAVGLTFLAAVIVILAAVAAIRWSPERVPSWLRVPVQTTVMRWLAVGDDRSLIVRIEEVKYGLPAYLRSPLFGLGLGSAVPVPPEADPSGFARNIASGYAFLLFKTGALGLALYLGLMGMIGVRAGQMVRNSAVSADSLTLSSIAFAGVLTLLLLNLVHRVSDISEGAIATALFAGVAAMPSRVDRS